MITTEPTRGVLCEERGAHANGQLANIVHAKSNEKSMGHAAAIVCETGTKRQLEFNEFSCSKQSADSKTIQKQQTNLQKIIPKPLLPLLPDPGARHYAQMTDHYAQINTNFRLSGKWDFSG